MVNKKDLISKFINKIKRMKKNNLINIYNKLLMYKQGGLIKVKTPKKSQNQDNIVIRRLQPQYQLPPQLLYPPQFPYQYIQHQPQQPQLITQKVSQGKCYVINDDITFEDVSKKKLLFPKKYDEKLTKQISIDASRFYNIISKIINDYDDKLNKFKYVCFNLNILSTTDNFYIFYVLLFLETYLNENKYKFSINKKENLINITYLNQEYIIRYKYDILTNSIDIKVGKKKDTVSSASKISTPISSKTSSNSRKSSNGTSANISIKKIKNKSSSSKFNSSS